MWDSLRETAVRIQNQLSWQLVQRLTRSSFLLQRIDNLSAENCFAENWPPCVVSLVNKRQ